MNLSLLRGMDMKETVYFGTYTRRLSKGIYKADFDTETGQLANLELFAAEPSPTYLALTNCNTYTRRESGWLRRNRCLQDRWRFAKSCG